MAIDTIAGLKTKRPPDVAGGTTVSDIYDVLDTMEDFTSQQVLTKTAGYPAVIADNRRHIVFNSPTGITLTLPNNLPVGWELSIFQLGAGAVTVSVTGGTLRCRSNHNKTAGLYAQAYMWVFQNTGSSPQVAFSGDTAL